MEVLKGIKVRIREEEIGRLVGYKGERPIGEFEDILAQEIEEGYRLIEPKAIYTQMRVKEGNGGSLVLEEGTRLSVGSGISLWEGADYLALALCTIGAALENRASELFAQGEYPAALVLDSAGSVAVESVADYVNFLICQMANRLAIKTGPRLSPGYGKWDLTEQRVLFSLLPGERIGVSLNEDFMMMPRKSISLCVGMGKGLGGKRVIDPCRHCGMENCKYRRFML
jgi:hypothetical protein